MTEFFWNSKDAMTMGTVNEFKTHGSGSVNGALISTRRAETTMAAKRNKFKVATAGAATKRRVTTTPSILLTLSMIVWRG